MDIQPYPIQMFWVIPDSSWVELNQVGYGYYPNYSGRIWILSKPDLYLKKKNLSHCHSLPLMRNHNNNNSNHNNYLEERFNGRDFLLKRSYLFGFERNLASERMVMEPATTSPWQYRRGNFWSKRPSTFGSITKLRVFSFRYYRGMKSSFFLWRGFFLLSERFVSEADHQEEWNQRRARCSWDLWWPSSEQQRSRWAGYDVEILRRYYHRTDSTGGKINRNSNRPTVSEADHQEEWNQRRARCSWDLQWSSPELQHSRWVGYNVEILRCYCHRTDSTGAGKK